MDQVVQASASHEKYMGTALVAIGDEVLFDKAYGSADLEWGIANTTDTKFRIGSVTKQFTAASILMLQERGALDLDQPVGTYLADTPESWAGVTLRHLLNHTSGIPNVTSLEDFGTWKYLPTTREEIIARFSDLPLEFAPGEKFAYSNSGFLLLTAVIEDVSGQPYAEFVTENIFAPLGMTNTAIDVTSAIVPRRADGYSPSKTGIVNADYVDMGIPQGAGALYSTTTDLVKWQRGLYGGDVLKPESLAEMTRPAIEAVHNSSAAMGLFVLEGEDGTLIWHGGGIEGFNAWLGYDPDREISVVVLANLNGGAANEIGMHLTTLARGGDVTLAQERTEIDTSGINLAEYTGTYTVTENFKIAFREEDGQLVTQATGQDAFPVFASGPDRFFLKVVDAQLAFNRNSDGRIVSVTLTQNGQEIVANRE